MRSIRNPTSPMPFHQLLRCLVLPVFFMASATVGAAVDLVGQWQSFRHEDRAHRGDGPELGDYTGLPINAAARQKAESWDASILSLPERQAGPHALAYAMHGPRPDIKIEEIADPMTQRLLAYRIVGLYSRAEDRVVWMDGRPHPTALAEHTWTGFSTGQWLGNVLVVNTTHLKMGFIQRNGVPASPYTTIEEHFVRHGDKLILFSWVDDPVYLEEPLVRSMTWRWSPTQRVGARIPFEATDELGNLERGYVPSWPLGTLHTEFSERYRIPLEASRGGARTLYPEYSRSIR